MKHSGVTNEELEMCAGCDYRLSYPELQSRLELAESLIGRLVEVVEIYSDSENEYFVDHSKTKIINGTKMYTMKNIVQMSKLAKNALDSENLKKWREND